MSLKWLAERLGRTAKRKKLTAREKSRRNRINRKINFELLESRTLLSASMGSLHNVAAAAGKLTGPALVSTHTTGATGPAAPTGGQNGGQTSGATPPTLSTAAAATLCVHVLPPAPLGPQGPGGAGGPGGQGGSTSSGISQTSTSTQSSTPNVITGTTITIAVQALDSNGVPTSNYSGTASVMCSDSSVTVPATLTFKNGIATFQATVGKIGTDTFTVTDTTTSTITGTATVDVVAAPKVTQYGVNILPPPPSGTGGGPGGTGSGSTGSTSGTTGPGTGQLPPPPPGQGGASSTGGSGGGGSNQLPPPPPPPPPPPQSGTTPNVTAGSTVTVQVVALDAKGNPVPNYTGTATVASSDTGVTVPTSITFKNGVAAFQVTLSTVESETLTVTSTDGTIDGSVTLSVVAASTGSTSTSSSQTKSAAAVVGSTSKTSSPTNAVKPAATVKLPLLRR